MCFGHAVTNFWSRRDQKWLWSRQRPPTQLIRDEILFQKYPKVGRAGGVDEIETSNHSQFLIPKMKCQKKFNLKILE
jgi:hypothetical protein